MILNNSNPSGMEIGLDNETFGWKECIEVPRKDLQFLSRPVPIPSVYILQAGTPIHVTSLPGCIIYRCSRMTISGQIM